MSFKSIKTALSPVLLALGVSTLALSTFSAQATIVEFQTSHGNFKVNLHDETTPKTVENFLKYVTDEDYNQTIIHRVETNFVMQGGGFYFEGEFPLKGIDTDNTIVNEPVYSNVRGTIAMAKVSGNANSATSQWFINLKDNSGGGAQLDLQNSGFTVFGEVIIDDNEDGMAIVDAISILPQCTGSAIPVTSNSDALCTSPSAENFVTITNIIITDSTVVTDASLASVKNTLINQPVEPPKKDSGGGGSLTWLSLALLGLLTSARKIKK
jgi:peptidyl-prolyl cis-trans isomerase A (cyclophilin A)